jgi:hypothetical protein
MAIITTQIDRSAVTSAPTVPASCASARDSVLPERCLFESTPVQPLEASRVTVQSNSFQVYQEITRRATPEERKQLEATLASLPEKDQHIQELLIALEKADWNAPIFKNPHYALEAVRQGKLSQDDYATVMIFWEMRQLHKAEEITTVLLFNEDGTANEEAKELIKETLIHRKMPNTKLFLDDKQLDLLFEKMKALPRLQQQIWIVPHIHEPIIDAIPLKTLAEVSDEDMMVAPMGLMQVFLDVAFGKDSVKLNPVHGLSSWKDLRQNHLDGKRDYALRCPKIALPDKADAHYARDFYFGKHDFYHALLLCSIPKKIRQYFIAIYDSIQSTTKDPNRGCGFIDLETIVFMNYFISAISESSLDDILRQQFEETALFSARVEKVNEAVEKNPNWTINQLREHLLSCKWEIEYRTKQYRKHFKFPTEPLWAM